ncbi:sensor histidine kinase [Acetatifactor muris]|uniref:Sensor histidine kinase YpdA n=1 Tax=Acetatifactor muris TaxID=879566 RepID=A0A2K4ZCV5_9FIRM|nr:sensor histidine kinase [Acetatifactor muris]MCR2046705.1 sensor histidine kinase [Acetatifactor muris]SOY28297.1 Sensor histidine kinase YpdA [Acetatifactor muris]
MIRRYTFLQKILILFLGGVMIPMLILNVVYYRQTEVNIQEEMLEKINEALDDKAEKIAGALSGVLSLAGNYYNNEMLYRYLDLEYGGDLEYLIQYQEELRRIFTDSSIYLYQVKNVMAYTDNNTLFNSSFIRKITNPEDGTLGENLSYLNVLPMGTDGNAWFRVAHEDVRFQKVYDSRSISILYHLNHYRQYSEYRKLLRINLDLERMEEILLESNLFDNMLLTDSNGRVFAAAKQYSNKGEMEIFAAAEEEKDGRMVLRRKIQDFPVILYGIYDTKMISEEFRQSRRLSGSISLVCMLFALVCVCAVAGSINRRLRRLVAQSEEIARGNFVRTELAEAGRDEFTILEKSLNHMSAQLQELIEKEYEARISQAELEKETNQAKLLALQAQVNPHFMFNALESIRLKAMIKGERETAGMIKYMAKMFRNILDWQDNIITIKEEIGFLDEFFHIQNYRFEDEFSYEINVTDQAYECLIPKMTLQPLAENACVHGVEAVSSNRRVRVEASVEKEWLKLRVEDNGGGMSPEKLRELKAMLKGEAEAGKSVGLWNIYRRLVLYYQENFRFDIDSVVGEGTTCTIRIPVKYANSD